jgi:hypothetical protein
VTPTPWICGSTPPGAQHGVNLFTAKRDVECFGRDMEANGRARATIARRLCTVAGFYRYAVEEDLLDHSPAAHVRRPRLDYESHAVGLDRNKVGALPVAAGLAPSPNTHSSHCWRSTDCGSPRRSAPTPTNSDSNGATAP